MVRAQIGGRAALAERFNFIDAVEILADAETQGVRRGPEHARESVHIIGDESGFVSRVKRLEFSNGLGIVDLHVSL